MDLPALDDIPLPPDPPRDLEDQVADLILVNAQLKAKLVRYGRDDQP
jgi:hypothetical protein